MYKKPFLGCAYYPEDWDESQIDFDIAKMKEAGISLQLPAKNVTKEQLGKLVSQLKSLRVDVTGSKTFEQAQVCAGGVNTDEVHNETLESYLTPGIYFAGELLDIDGICGGYNLQWAWSSGYVAGLHAAKACK